VRRQRGERERKKKNRATIVYEMAISDSNSNHLNKKTHFNLVLKSSKLFSNSSSNKKKSRSQNPLLLSTFASK